MRLGEHDISSTSDGEIQDIKVGFTQRHENYNKRDGTNDIAVLHLAKDADLSSEIIFSFNVRISIQKNLISNYVFLKFRTR